jgi:hypothetical protein
MANLDLEDIHDTLIAVARKAGEMITAAHPTTSAAGNKKNCTAGTYLSESFESASIANHIPQPST